MQDNSGKHDWFYEQAGTPLAGLWVALEGADGMPGPRILDSDESLVNLVCRLDGRLHQGVLIGRVPRAVAEDGAPVALYPLHFVDSQVSV